MEHIYDGTPAAELSSDAKTRVSSYGYQAYQILRLGFIVAPIVAGLDKFFHLLVDWGREFTLAADGLKRATRLLRAYGALKAADELKRAA